MQIRSGILFGIIILKGGFNCPCNFLARMLGNARGRNNLLSFLALRIRENSLLFVLTQSGGTEIIMKVCELMNSNVVVLRPDDTTTHAATLLARHNIGALPVCAQDGRLRGIVTDRDIVIRCVAGESHPEEVRVREIMTRGIASVSPEDDVRAAAHIMATEQVRRLPVVERGRLVGMLSLSDLARSEKFDMEASRAFCEISSPPPKFS